MNSSVVDYNIKLSRETMTDMFNATLAIEESDEDVNTQLRQNIVNAGDKCIRECFIQQPEPSECCCRCDLL
jgi:hypothetical protein